MSQENNILKNSKHPIIASLLWAVCILLFYSIGGYFAVTKELNPTDSFLVQGCGVWGSVIFAFIYIKVRHISMKQFGFRVPVSESIKQTYYLLPIIVLEASGFMVGFRELNLNYILATLFLTIAVGFSEEMYFRGFVLSTLENLGQKKVILIGSAIFGCAHSANALGGKNIFLTLLQIVFAFIFGVVFCEVYLLTKSIWPCIIIHFLHDCFTYIQSDEINTITVVCMVAHVLIIIFYAIVLWKKLSVASEKSTIPSNAAIN